MARGNVVDVSAMYQAGLAGKKRPEDLDKKRAKERLQALTDVGFQVLGSVAVDATKRGLKHMRDYRNAADSQMSGATLAINKISPENAALKERIRGWGKDYDKAVRKSYNIFNKEKRLAAKEEAAMIMTKLHTANAGLVAYQAGTEKSQAMMNAKLGIGNDTQNRMNPGNNSIHEANIYEQGDLSMAKLLDFDDNGNLIVKRGGSWQDVTAEDGTVSNMYLDVNGGTDGLTTPKYSDMNFGSLEDNTVEQQIKSTRKDFKEMAFSEDPMPWDNVSGDYKEEFYSFINNSTNAQFRDFFFGGFSHEFTSNRKETTSPAYTYLRDRAMNEASPEDNTKVNYRVENGKNVFDSWKEGYGTSSDYWKGEMLALKNMDFDYDNDMQAGDGNYHSGSRFREMVAESQWNSLEQDYLADRGVKEGMIEDKRIAALPKIKEGKLVRVEFRGPSGKVIKTTTNELQTKQNNLSALEESNSNSFATDKFVNMFGFNYGYFPGKGFAEVDVSEDGQVKLPKEAKYFKTVNDVMVNMNANDKVAELD